MCAATVSVIVPTYNRSRLLLESLGSIVGQSYRPVEVIVVDDGSTDDTRLAFENWQQEQPTDAGLSLTYVYQENAGASAARNTGLGVATGSYIHFLDSDDLLINDIYQQTVPYMESNAIDTIHFGLMFSDSSSNEEPVHHAADAARPLLDQFFQGKLKGYGFGFIRTREVINTAGLWDTGLKIAEDRDFCLRTLLASKAAEVLPAELYQVRLHGGERLSEDKISAEWWQCRLLGESKIAGLMDEYAELLKYRSQFRANLYNVGIRLYDAGLIPLGKAFGELAKSLGDNGTSPGEKRMRRVWALGPLASRLWILGRTLKSRFSRRRVSELNNGLAQ
jgi:glycosyltransferase involved in cell wall biosynthesis